MMARNVNSETYTVTNTNGRGSPLLLRYFRGIDRPVIRQVRSFRDENVRYRFLKWIALSISTVSVVNIQNCKLQIKGCRRHRRSLCLLSLES